MPSDNVSKELVLEEKELEFEVWTVEALAKWYRKFREWRYTFIAFAVILIFWIILDVSCLSNWFGYKIFLVQESISLKSIIGRGLPIALLLLLIIFAVVDYLSSCFERMGRFSHQEAWGISGALEIIRKHPPKNEKEAAQKEMDLLVYLSHETKYIVLRLTLKLVIAAAIFVIAFGLIFTLVNRFSVNGTHAFGNICTNSSVLWHVFYSLDVLTTLGGAAPTPQVGNSLIWIFSGIELAMAIVFTILCLTLAVASVYELFNFKSTYFSAYIRSVTDKIPKTSENNLGIGA